MTNQKGSAAVILLVVLVVVLAGVLVYFAFLKKPGEVAVSPTPTPMKTATPTPGTVGWKSYTNTRIGYTFEYPQGMKVVDAFKYPNGNNMIPNMDQVDITAIIVNNALPSGVDPLSYEIRVFMNEGYNSIENWITDTANGHGEGGTDTTRGHDLSQYQKITLSGQTAYKLIVQNKEVYIATMASGNVYTIRVFDESHSNSFNRYQTLQHLISSFQISK